MWNRKAPWSNCRVEMNWPLRPNGRTTRSASIPTMSDSSQAPLASQVRLPKLTPLVTSSTWVPGCSSACRRSACSSAVISLPSSSTPPAPNTKGGLMKRPEIAAKPLPCVSARSGATTPGSALAEPAPAPPTAKRAGMRALLPTLWHSRQLWLSRPLMRRKLPTAPSVGLPPGATGLPGSMGPSPWPSCSLKGVAKTRRPASRMAIRGSSEPSIWAWVMGTSRLPPSAPAESGERATVRASPASVARLVCLGILTPIRLYSGPASAQLDAVTRPTPGMVNPNPSGQ